MLVQLRNSNFIFNFISNSCMWLVAILLDSIVPELPLHVALSQLSWLIIETESRGKKLFTTSKNPSFL